MSRIVNMHEAKTTLSKLVEDVMNGATIYLARNGSPVAKIVPLAEEGSLRPIGLHDKGRDSTPQEIAEAMAPTMTDQEVEEWLNKSM